MRGYFYERAFVNTKTFYICSLRTSVRILRGLRFQGLVITNERSYMKGLEISGSRLYERTFVYVIVAGVRIRTRVRIYMGFRGACLRTCVRKHVTSLGVGCLRTCVRKHLDWEGQITAPGFTGIVHSSVRTSIYTYTYTNMQRFNCEECLRSSLQHWIRTTKFKPNHCRIHKANTTFQISC